MSQSVVDKVFEPFFTTKIEGEGTGLGLTAVSGIVKAHGGEIHCRSEPGAGTTFSMSFEVPRQPVQEPVSLQTEGTGPGPGGTETILVVDDEDAILSMLNRALSNVGYHVLTAANVDDALETYAAGCEDIALVILDLDMPRGGGSAFLERIDEAGLKAKVIIASGNPDGAASVEQFRTRIAAFVAKPFTLSELEGNIRLALES